MRSPFVDSASFLSEPLSDAARRQSLVVSRLLMLALVVVGAVVAINYWNGAPLLSDPRTGRPAASYRPPRVAVAAGW